MGTMLYLLVFLVLACSAHGSSVKRSTGRFMDSTTFGLTGRIVNGTKAAPMQFPHQVSLKRSWSKSYFCGGSIISEELVLTAAHCMYLSNKIIEPWTILVTGGDIKLNSVTPTTQKRAVKAIILHPQFNNITLQNDIAILKLMIPFAMTSAVRSAPLPTSDVVPETLCTVSGWGYTSANVPIVSSDLMYVELPIREPKECRKLLINVTRIYPGMYCAGFLEGGKDACQGDSGGGMVCNDVLSGVVSGGQGCALPQLPGVYSSVFHYRDWIESIDDTKEKKDDDGSNSCARKTPRIMTVALILVLSIMIGP